MENNSIKTTNFESNHKEINKISLENNRKEIKTIIEPEKLEVP